MHSSFFRIVSLHYVILRRACGWTDGRGGVHHTGIPPMDCARAFMLTVTLAVSSHRLPAPQGSKGRATTGKRFPVVLLTQTVRTPTLPSPCPLQPPPRLYRLHQIRMRFSRIFVGHAVRAARPPSPSLFFVVAHNMQQCAVPRFFPSSFRDRSAKKIVHICSTPTSSIAPCADCNDVR